MKEVHHSHWGYRTTVDLNTANQGSSFLKASDEASHFIPPLRHPLLDFNCSRKNYRSGWYLLLTRAVDVIGSVIAVVLQRFYMWCLSDAAYKCLMRILPVSAAGFNQIKWNACKHCIVFNSMLFWNKNWSSCWCQTFTLSYSLWRMAEFSVCISCFIL